ncbi:MULTISPECIES: signal peptidase II [Aerococcus]|uniref:Lipoprotein signal peptidase n=1 Tax=Aerococcus sanguinicola TaxID=119206 RepID=A0A5N1GLZ4_9LACT|nr:MULTISPECIES: signal peptidase II [Aerococcus]KAA9301995.1 signal peptidase II [Aerococcus sanguinicola]MDK6368580.1 signal peptidase II [Aerococcus sp. UMB9870]MDK6679663.1 signal peptidase II [Aerococcus sp. UMB8608]MDK6686507.1 signal peptidase II [Aerococcus sp. UMB8623]MDK6940871.1 signal peptidase II [Aerococcus sp. UMB8487]
MWIACLIIALSLVLDQVVKAWTVNHLALLESQSLIPHVLSLQYIQNRGAAWGMLEGQMGFFFIITFVVVGVLTYTLYKERKQSLLLRTALSLMIGGALGNFIDRLRLGYVVDMFRLDFIDFPIFNLADVCLTLGVFLCLIYLLFFEEADHGKHSR